MKMARFQTFYIRMQKNKPLDENRKSGQTSGTKMSFYSSFYLSRVRKFFRICTCITLFQYI
ncbi:hypothetical protein Hanom_Chr01g00024311 [Helianthus anomalus]